MGSLDDSRIAPWAHEPRLGGSGAAVSAVGAGVSPARDSGAREACPTKCRFTESLDAISCAHWERRWSDSFVVALLVSAGVALSGVLRAEPPTRYSVVVADSQATVYRYDPQTRKRVVLAQRGSLDRPYKLARDANGNIVVSDTGTIRVVLINEASGEQVVLAQGPSVLGVPYGLAVDGRGLIYVANSQALVLINPATRGVEIFAEGRLLRTPLDVAVAPDGNLYVADARAGIVRIDPETKAQTLVTSGREISGPTGLVADRDHRLYVVDPGNRSVVAVDTGDGSQRVVSKAGPLRTPVGIALGPGGALLVSDPDALELDGAIFAIAGDGIPRTIARGAGELVNPRGILFVPSNQEPGGSSK